MGLDSGDVRDGHVGVTEFPGKRGVFINRKNPSETGKVQQFDIHWLCVQVWMGGVLILCGFSVRCTIFHGRHGRVAWSMVLQTL